MSETVTVYGTNQSVVSIPIDTAANAILSQSLLNAVSKDILDSKVTPYNLGGAVPGGPVELVISGNAPVGLTAPDNAGVIVDNATKLAIITGGKAAVQQVVSGEGGISYTANLGIGTVIAGGGNNEIIAKNPLVGAHTYLTGNGDDTIYAAFGDSTIDAGLGKNLITLGSGTAKVTVRGTDDITTGVGDDEITVQETGKANIHASTDADLVVYNFGQVTLTGTTGSGNLDFVNAGFATVFSGSGSTTIHGPGGGYYKGGSAGFNDLSATSSLSATLVGGGSGDVLQVGGGGIDLIIAGPGNETLIGTGTDGATFVTGTGDNVVKAGDGADTIQDGTGNDTITGGAGADLFVFTKGTAGGHTEIKDFATKGSNGELTLGLDSIVLVGYAGHTIDQIIKTQVPSPNPAPGGSVTVSLGDGTTITFDGIQSITAASFVKVQS